MNTNVYNVLFLDTGNSARSIMAEAILNHLGKGRFRAFSAGSHPAMQINPLVIEQIKRANLPSDGLHSKNWQEFVTLDAPQLDFVIYLCSNTAKDVNLVWHGHPMTTLWEIDDPTATIDGGEGASRRTYAAAFTQIKWRISTFINLPLTKLEEMALRSELEKIGHLRERRSSLREQ